MGPRQRVKGACGFCHVREQDQSGRLYKTPDDEVAAHLNCMLFSPTLVTQSSPDENSFGGFLLEDVKKEIKRGRRLKCSSCKQSGATIGCDVKKCKKSFHYLCATKCGAKFIEDEKNGIYKIYCDRHKENGTLNGDEDCDDSNGANITTDDYQTEQSHDDVSDDGTFDGDNENDGSLWQNEQTRNGVENTPKRNVLTRAKTNTPHGPSGKVTNGGSSHVDVSENSTAPTPSRIPGGKCKFTSQDSSRMVTESKRRRGNADSDSSTSSTSISAQKTREGEPERPIGKKKMVEIVVSRLINRLSCPQAAQQSHIDGQYVPVETMPEGPMDDNPRVENVDPQWISLLSWYHARITEQSHISGQNTMKPRDFWQLCRKAKCTEALCNKIITSLESRMQRIQTQTASKDDYAQVFEVLMTTGCLQTITIDLKNEIKDQQKALERKQEALILEEKKLNEILPTLNRPSASEVLNETAGSFTPESE